MFKQDLCLMHNISISQLTPETLPELKSLLLSYGHYMFDELQLTAGKEKFYRELSHFPLEKYSPPEGCFLIGLLNNDVVACAGISRFNNDSCELKRMFTLPQARNKGIGSAVMRELFRQAKQLNYKTILLDTNREMPEAVKLYLSAGFVEIDAYCINENDHPIYMKYSLE